MESIGIIREFRTAQFRVIVDAIPEYDADLSWDEDGSTRNGIESGRLVLFCARARVVHDTLGELAADYLGSCVYESLDAFQDHRKCAAETRRLRAEHGRDDIVCGSYFSDMVSNVCKEARKQLRKARSIYVRPQ